MISLSIYHDPISIRHLGPQYTSNHGLHHILHTTFQYHTTERKAPGFGCGLSILLCHRGCSRVRWGLYPEEETNGIGHGRDGRR
jgi:hypothetical protein